MDDVLYDTTDVTVSLGIVEGSELGWGLVQTGVGRCRNKWLVNGSFDVCSFLVFD